MAEWRDRGYVPDSDDEDVGGSEPGANPSTQQNANRNQLDDGNDQAAEANPGTAQSSNNLDGRPWPSQGRPPCTPTRPETKVANMKVPTPTTAEKLEAELRQGLQTCKYVLQSPTILPFLDGEGSPLSSLSSSPASQSPLQSGSPATSQALACTVALEDSETLWSALSEAIPNLNYGQGITSAGENSPVLLRGSRSLRPRTQLQLNPYSLEYARYQQDCKRRGLMPVRPANFAAERAPANNEETQGSATFQSSDRISLPARGSSPVNFVRSEAEEGHQNFDCRRQQANPNLGSDDELPDVADILQGRVRAFDKTTRKTHRKKDKNEKPMPRTESPVFKHYDLPELPEHDRISTRQSSVFDLPPSPPHSGSVSDQSAVFPVNDAPISEASPRLLPTPLLSSDRQSRKRKVIEFSSSSQEQDTDEEEIGRSSSASQIGNEDSQGLVQIRRKIKGVLPASWLKLDAKQQKTKLTTNLKSASPEKLAASKGIAKHVASAQIEATPKGTALSALTFSSDLEESSASELEDARQPILPALDLGFFDSDLEMDDVVVEDIIDRLEPPVRRSFDPRKAGRKRQQQLDNKWRGKVLPKSRRDHGALSIKPDQTRPKKPTTKRAKRRHQAAQLTVLDAPSFRSATRRDQPSYLRVAARKQVSVRRAITQDPARKYFRLATREDTVDVNGDLEEWRSGRLIKAQLRQNPIITDTNVTQQTQLFEQVSPQDESTAVDVSHGLARLKLSTAATISRLRAQEVGHRYSTMSRSSVKESQAGRRQLALVLEQRVNHSGHARSNVPRWLGRVSMPFRSSVQPALKCVAPVRPARSLVAPDDQIINLSPADTRQKTVRRHKRKQRPAYQAVAPLSNSNDEDDLVSAPPTWTASSMGAAAQRETEQDRDLTSWAIDHLAMADGLEVDTCRAQSSYPSVDSAESIEDVVSKLFSWHSLQKTYSAAVSLWTSATARDGLQGTVTPLQRCVESLRHCLGTEVSSERRRTAEHALRALIETTYMSPLSRLAATLLILQILCAVPKSDSYGMQPAPSSTKSVYDGWTILHPAISSFLSLQMTIERGSRNLNEGLGFMAVRLCHRAVREWCWPSADSIAKFWFKQYAENNMVELFVVPNLSLLESRSQQIVLTSELQPCDTDFDIFLRMTPGLLKHHAGSVGLSGGVGRSASRIQSLVFSLSPNNSRELLDDQNLNMEDLVSMANIYALYEFLNEFAPSGCQPRFSLIDKLINFPTCHWSVCKFAIRAWSRFTHNAIDRADHGNVLTLGLWMKKTIVLMNSKIAKAHLEALELRLSGAQFTFRENSSRTSLHILELLQAWKGAVVRCPSTTELGALLGDGDLEEVVKICQDEAIKNDKVLLAICDIIQSYLDKSVADALDDFRKTLHRQFRSTLSVVLSSELHVPSHHLRAMATLWFNFAKIAVRHKHKDWDDFLTLPSSWSFAVLAGSAFSRQCKCLFMSNIIKHDSLQFELDREPFYTAWIEGMVQPEHKLQFENELTLSIVQRETEDLSFKDLRSMFEDVNGQLQLSLEDLKQHRLDIVEHIIRNLYSLQWDDEDSQDFLEKPLNVHQGRKLLRLMTDTIKIQWKVMPSTQRQPYTDFAWAVLTQLRIYKYKGYEIDPWFVDPQESEFPKDITFGEHFLLPLNAQESVVDEHMVRIFTSATLHAVGTDQEQAWVHDITRALSANNPTIIGAGGRLAINAHLQFDFVRKVMSPFLQNAFKSERHALFARPVIAALNRIVRDWHFRLDIGSDSVLEQMLEGSVELLSALRTPLASERVMLVSEKGSIGGPILQLLELAVACTRRLTMIEPLLEETEENIENLGCGYAHALEVYELMTGLHPHIDEQDQQVHDSSSFFEDTVLSILDEGLLGPADHRTSETVWHSDDPLACTWEAWMCNSEEQLAEACQKHIALMLQFENVLIDAEVLQLSALETGGRLSDL